MLNEKQIPKVFLLKALKWRVHIQNRCPIAADEIKTPKEAWSGEKHVVEYFRAFGCTTHVHVLNQIENKLDDKSKKYVFLGINDESNAWRLYDSISKNIIVTKDDIFEEN